MKYILGPFPPRNQSNMSPFFWSENTCTTGSILKSLMSHTTISKTFDNLGYSWSFLSNSYINTIQLGFLIWTFIKSFLVNNSINSNGSFSEKKKNNNNNNKIENSINKKLHKRFCYHIFIWKKKNERKELEFITLEA